MAYIKITDAGVVSVVDDGQLIAIQPNESIIAPALEAVAVEVIDPWTPDVSYFGSEDLSANPDIVQHDGLVYRCRQSHTSQLTWTPSSDTLAIWAPVLSGGDWPDWVAPQSGFSYPAGQQCTHNGTQWISDINGNIYEPGVFISGQTYWSRADGEPVIPPSEEWQANYAYSVNDIVTYLGLTYTCLQAHTSQVGWEPPNVPALWLLVE